MEKLPEKLEYAVNCELDACNELEGINTRQIETYWVHFDVITYQKPGNTMLILKEIFIDSCQDGIPLIVTPMRYKFRNKLISRNSTKSNDVHDLNWLT